MYTDRNCEWCGSAFTPDSPTTKYCSGVCKRRQYLYGQIPEEFHTQEFSDPEEFFRTQLLNQETKRLYKTRIEDWVIEASPNGQWVQYWVDKIESLYPDPKLSRVKKFNLYIKEMLKAQAKKPKKTSICQVCVKEYEVRPLARKSFTCSPECQDFRKVNKLSPDEIEQAKAAFDPENLVEWANQFMCRQNIAGPGYNQTAFEDPRWARLNRLEEEVQVVCKAINAHNMDVPSEADEKLSRRDLWKAWQKGTQYRPCAHCGGLGKFHKHRGWQEFCSKVCERHHDSDHHYESRGKSTGKCRVCGFIFPIKELSPRTRTCSGSECRRFHNKNKQPQEFTEEARSQFKELELQDWANQYLSSRSKKDFGYNPTRFEDSRWARLNGLENEVNAVNEDIKRHNANVPKEVRSNMSKRNLWKAWQKGSEYRPCSHCGGVGKFRTPKWQEFCSQKCFNEAMADSHSDLKGRILASYRNVDHETRKVKYEQTMVERYGYKSNLGDSDTIDAIMETKRNNNPDWGRSRLEKQLAEHLKGLGVEVIENDRKLIGRELDIYLPEFKVAIEVNGVIYHSEKYDFDEQGQPRPKKKETRARHRHIWKTKECEEQGVHLIHVWHDEINTAGGFKRFINRLNHMLGFTKGRIYGRQTKVVERTKEDIKRFLNQHHLQGSVSNFSKGFGLEKDGMLVAVMTFTNNNDGSVTLSRFASIGVVGGFSKLLKHFTKLHPETDVYSFGDRDKVNRWNNVYLSNGFEEVEVLRPDYMYTNGGGRRHKFGFRKRRLLAKHPDLNPNWTEYEMALNLGYYRVWGTGLFKYKLIK